jgi:hypothetical protein
MPVRSSFVTDPYLKHRSLRLDLAIIAETARTLVADREYPATALCAGRRFMLSFRDGAPI